MGEGGREKFGETEKQRNGRARARQRELLGHCLLVLAVSPRGRKGTAGGRDQLSEPARRAGPGLVGLESRAN